MGDFWVEDINEETFLDSLQSEVSPLQESRELINQITNEINELRKKKLEPEFILLNKRNYEKLITYLRYTCKTDEDEFLGLKIVIWDVPIDYCNIRCKASVEYQHMRGL